MGTKNGLLLSRNFSWVAGPVIACCVIASGFFSWIYAINNICEQGEQVNVAIGRTILNTYQHEFNEYLHSVSEKRIDKELAYSIISGTLVDPVSDLIDKTEVVKVKIFTPDGYTVFSTVDDEVNTQSEVDSLALQSFNGKQNVTEMKEYESFYIAGGVLTDAFIINTHFPVYLTGTNKIIGVMELYSDFSGPYNKLIVGLFKYTFTLIALGVICFLSLYYFVRKSERFINVQMMKERHQAEMLSIAVHKAEESTRTRNQFLANMSHELRTPLNAIMGYSDLLLEEESIMGSESQTKDLNKIKKASSHLLVLLTQILDHAKIQSNMISINTADCFLCEIMDSAVSSISLDAEDKRNRVVIEACENVDAINTDNKKLNNILVNLLANANKYTEGGTITLRSDVQNDTLIIKVIDTGIGIPEEKLETIFEPFTQIDNTSSREHDGAGLGLSISREFARIMGGDLMVESEEGKGTTFTLTIPFCPILIKNEDSPLAIDITNNNIVDIKTATK